MFQHDKMQTFLEESGNLSTHSARLLCASEAGGFLTEKMLKVSFLVDPHGAALRFSLKTNG